MNRTRAKYVGVAAAIAAAVLAGCGGGQNGVGGQEGEAPQAPTGQAPEGQQPPEGQPPPGGQPPPEGQQPPGGQDAEAAKAELQGQLDQLLEQNPITFQPDSAELTQQGQETVNKAVETVNQAPPETRFQVVGHVAKTGSPDNAQQLSEERAQAVADRIAEAGISADRMEVVGKGDSEPKESLEASRRVEIKLL